MLEVNLGLVAQAARRGRDLGQAVGVEIDEHGRLLAQVMKHALERTGDLVLRLDDRLRQAPGDHQED